MIAGTSCDILTSNCDWLGLVICCVLGTLVFFYPGKYLKKRSCFLTWGLIVLHTYFLKNLPH